MNRRIIISAFLSFSLITFSQKTEVKWYTIKEADELVKTKPRPIFIDTYTDWCGFCKKLDKETFSNPVIAEILNTMYYPVKFNAESQESITFQGKNFIYDGKSGNANQLAVALLQGKLSYPTSVFFDEKGQYLGPVPGFHEAKEMEMILSYFANKTYEKQKWDEFQKSFKGKIP